MWLYGLYMDDLFSLKIRKNQEEAEQLQKRLVKARYEKLLEMLLLLLSLAIISPGGKKKFFPSDHFPKISYPHTFSKRRRHKRSFFSLRGIESQEREIYFSSSKENKLCYFFSSSTFFISSTLIEFSKNWISIFYFSNSPLSPLKLHFTFSFPIFPNYGAMFNNEQSESIFHLFIIMASKTNVNFTKFFQKRQKLRLIEKIKM